MRDHHRPEDKGSKQITRRNNPEDNHIHARRRENLKSHKQPALVQPKEI
jgi:hypothetical protein